MRKYARDSIKMGKKKREGSLLSTILSHKFILIGAGAFLLVALIVCVILLLQPKDTSSPLEGAREDITVAVWDSNSPFCDYDHESEEFFGFEIDLITELIHRIYTEDIYIEFLSTTSQTATAAVRKGDASLAIAMLAPGVPKTQGFVLTDSYYIDEISFMLDSSSSITSADQLGEKTVGVLYTIIDDGIATDYFESRDISAEVLLLASSEDGLSGLEDGSITALVAPKQHLMRLDYSSAKYIADDMGTIPYNIVMAPGTATSTKDIFDEKLLEMVEDGTVESLIKKWNLD